MSLRVRFVVALVALSTLAAVTIGWFSYRSTEAQSLDALDSSLNASVESLRSSLGAPGGGPRRPPSAGFGDQADQLYRQVRAFRAPDDVVWEVVDADGEVVIDGAVDLPAPPDLGLQHEGSWTQQTRDVTVDGETFRMTSISLRDGAVLQVARSLDGIDDVLSGLRREIALASLAIAVAAAAIGWVIARRMTEPLIRVTTAAESVAATGDLSTSVPVERGDEAGRLAGSFNEMLSALRRSKEQQQRLVQNAGHELRTPLTSLRTNVFLLDRWDRMDPTQRSQMIADLRAETEELTVLIDEVVGAATDQIHAEPVADVVVADVARAVGTRVGSRTGRTVVVNANQSVVKGYAQSIERAIANLVENACKFDPSGRPIEVTVVDGAVTVRDHGPGIAASDRPLVTERFYRSDAARSAPGSGLGLAIVTEVAAEHGGVVTIEDPADGDGGVVVGFTMVPEA